MENNKQNRRRSSFFQRRHSLYKESPKEATCNEADLPSEKEVMLAQYINKLKREKKDWNSLLEKMKKENAEFKQRTPAVLDQSSSWAQLTSEDKEFLQGQVDYISLGKLLDSTAEAVAMRQQRTIATTNKLVNLLRDYNQSNIDLTSEIIYRSIHNFDEFNLSCDEFSDLDDVKE